MINQIKTNLGELGVDSGYPHNAACLSSLCPRKHWDHLPFPSQTGEDEVLVPSCSSLRSVYPPTLNRVEGISAVTQALGALESHRHVWASLIGLVSSGCPFLIKLRSIRKDSVDLHQAVLFLQSRGGRQSIRKAAPGPRGRLSPSAHCQRA